MRKQKKSMLVLTIITAFIAAGLFLPGVISAGDLEPTGPPGPTMKTLDEIYNLIDERCPYSTEAAVPKTGQDNSYATGDDGELEKGVAWPNPRFTDNGDGTVTDNLTKLIWLKNANCFEARTWANALSDCNSLASESCGLTDGSVAGDWRLPNVKELQSLIHYGVYSPAVPNTTGTRKWSEDDPFTNVQASYWSGSTYAGGTSTAWVVSMYYGYVTNYNKSDSHYVWPVRGGN
jgi:hypothetical protein